MSCLTDIPIPFATVGSSKLLAVNQRSVLACKCAGDTLAKLQILCAMMELPPPVLKNAYTKHVKIVREKAVLQAEASMSQARKEVREHYDASSEDETIDILVSCDGTWQR